MQRSFIREAIFMAMPLHVCDPSLQLAIESSGTSASLCIGILGEILVHRSLPNTPRTAASLAPAIQSLMKEQSLDAQAMAQLAVTVGPGSFTGLRVGIATVKALAFAWNIPVAAIDTLDAMAASAIPFCEAQIPASHTTTLWSALNAYRGEVFCSRWLRTDGRWHCSQPSIAQANEIWQSQLLKDAALSLVWVAGSRSLMASDLQHPNIRFLPHEYAQPSVESVFQLGWQAREAGTLTTWEQLQPKYLRGSAAEVKSNHCR